MAIMNKRKTLIVYNGVNIAILLLKIMGLSPP